MSKAVMLSIRPQWCELIAQGKKTVEVRKTRPKIEPPFRCYIYQTLPKSGDWNERDGRVIGEFVCDATIPLEFYASDESFFDTEPPFAVPETGMTDREIAKYLGNGKLGYGWHISDLVIYDTPKKLNEFAMCKDCGKYFKWHRLTRPPQSWCYVEEED